MYNESLEKDFQGDNAGTYTMLIPSKLKRWGSLALLCLTLLPLVACKDKTPLAKKIIKPVQTIVIKKIETASLRSFPGKVLATKQVTLSFKVAGQLVERHILKGSSVKKGQLLARLDPKKFQDEVNELKAKYIHAKTEYEQASALVHKGSISQPEFNAKKSRLHTAESNYSTAKRNLSDTNMYAPFSGVISKKYVNNYQNIKENQPIYKLQDISSIDIEINVPENIMINLRQDADKDKNPVAIFTNVSQQKFPLKFKEFSTEADSETQTYKIILTMPAPQNMSILPSMSVNVVAIIPDTATVEGKPYYSIPSSAVFMNENNQSSVWIVDQTTMKVKQVNVQSTRLTGKNIKIINGIKPGDRIVTADVHFLHEGQEVKLLELPKGQ